MLTKTQTWALVAVVLFLWIAISLARGESRPTHLLTSLSYVVSGTSIVLVLWERWVWRCRIFRPWLTARPDVRGTWKGELVSSWPDPETGQQAGPIEVYLVVRQTFSSVDARMFSLESESVSLSASVVNDGPELHNLFIFYRNEPKTLLREASPIHYGGMLLQVRGARVERLDGEYWTDRRTKGQATFLKRSKRVSLSFTDAASLFG